MKIQISLTILGMILGIATTGLVTALSITVITTTTQLAFAENDGEEGQADKGNDIGNRSHDDPAPSDTGGGSPGKSIDDNDKGQGCGSGLSDGFGRGGQEGNQNSGGKC